jgi:hypothetical protein
MIAFTETLVIASVVEAKLALANQSWVVAAPPWIASSLRSSQ